MNRIEKAYATRFQDALRQWGARREWDGWLRLRARARRLSDRRGVSLAQAYHLLEMELTEAWTRYRTRLRSAEPTTPRHFSEQAPAFYCDSGLGGLTRWLRAAGYRADWFPGVRDADLIRLAQEGSGFLLTTDSLMMERGVLRDGQVPALWLSPALTMEEQLRCVLRHLNLPLRPSRCMACGGPLQSVSKDTVWSRIPPKTRLWRDEFFVCGLCDRLFWHGTHWNHIQSRLQRLAWHRSPAARAG